MADSDDEGSARSRSSDENVFNLFDAPGEGTSVSTGGGNVFDVLDGGSSPGGPTGLIQQISDRQPKGPKPTGAPEDRFTKDENDKLVYWDGAHTVPWGWPGNMKVISPFHAPRMVAQPSMAALMSRRSPTAYRR